jgi:hypothetical protein
MKKYTLLLVLVLCLSQLAFAGPKFGIGGNLGLPTGTWKDYVSSVAFGGTAQAMMPFGENMAIGAQAGYLIFGSKSFGVAGVASVEWDVKAIPILGVYRYYLGVPGGPRPFVGAYAGFHLFQNSVTSEITIPFFGTSKVTVDDNTTKFSFGPAGGVEIGALEIAAAYMLISDFNYIYVRLGFNFGGVE